MNPEPAKPSLKANNRLRKEVNGGREWHSRAVMVENRAGERAGLQPKPRGEQIAG